MSASLGSAVLDLTVDGSGLEEGMGEAEQTTQSRMGRIGGTVAKGAKIAGAAVAGMGAAAIGGAFKVADYGDELDKTSSKLGINTDFLQDAHHWASQNGLSAQSMERGVGRLNQRVGRAIDGNEKYAQAFDDVGVSLKDAQGNTRDTEDVMRDTIDALQDIEDPAQRSAAASEIFGTKMARDLMPALEDGSLSLEDATAAMDEHGRMSEEQVAKSAEFSDAWDNIKTAGMGLLREGLTPVMSFLADRVFPVIQEHIIPALQQFGEWLGPKLQAAAEVVSAFFEERVLPAFMKLAQWWAENGPAIMERAQALWDGLGAAFEAIGEIWNRVVGFFQSGGDDTNELWAQMREVAATVWELISTLIGSAVDWIRDAIDGFVTAAQWIWDNFGDTITSVAETVWGHIQNVIDGALSIIQGILDTVMGLITGDWQRAWDGILSILEGLWTIIRSTVESAISVVWDLIQAGLDLVRDLWDTVWSWVAEKAAEILANVISTVSSGIDDVVQFFRDLPGTIRGMVSDAGRWLLDAGKNIIGGLIDGIESMIGRVRDTISDVASTVRDALPFSPAKYGPLSGSGSPDLAGEKIAEMLAGGLDDGSRDVTASMHRMVDFDIGRHGAGGPGSVGGITVYLGDREITDIVGVEIDGKFAPAGRVARSR